MHAPVGSPWLLTFLLFICTALVNPQPHRNQLLDLSSHRPQAQREEMVLRARNEGKRWKQQDLLSYLL